MAGKAQDMKNIPAASSSRPSRQTFAEMFTPKLVSVLREGYDFAAFRADAIAGLTVAIVALPLSMAIAIACGLSPDRGLYTAIVGGFIISAFGGSRFQIGGPAGAFIVLIAAIVERHGYDGLVLATTMAGVVMMVVGFLRLGTYIKYIPFPVIIGFTAGIAVIIFASQIKDLLGLDIAREPAAFLPKLLMIGASLQSFKPATIAVAALAVGIILILRKVRPTWPGLLIAVVTGAVAATVLTTFGQEIATIGSRFGGVPSSLPAPEFPAFSLEKARAVLPDALAIALLGAIESLLSAVVADGMSGGQHRSNCELVAQGAGNIASVMFGGVPVTGTIARTATNVRAGSRGPVSGMLHAVYLLAFMLVAAPLASYIPLAALAAVLAVVSWNMAEKHEFAALLRASRGEALVLMSTFLLTVFENLLLGIAVGLALHAILRFAVKRRI
jgi:SulP family sulfate permease